MSGQSPTVLDVQQLAPNAAVQISIVIRMTEVVEAEVVEAEVVEAEVVGEDHNMVL
jgi:hypothetical protein